MAAVAGLLAPIAMAMRRLILASRVVGSDDTSVPVQDPSGKGIKSGRLSVIVGDHDHPYVVYDYTPDHSAAGPEAIFAGFKGYLQADAGSIDDRLYRSGEIVEAGYVELDNGACERAFKPVALGRNCAGLGIMRSRTLRLVLSPLVFALTWPARCWHGSA